MLYFELWCCVKVSQEEKWEEMASVSFPEEIWRRRAEWGEQMKAKGLRDNLWEGKWELVNCSDHRDRCALLIPLQLCWSDHTVHLQTHTAAIEPRAAVGKLHIQHAQRLKTLSFSQKYFLFSWIRLSPCFQSHRHHLEQNLHHSCICKFSLRFHTVSKVCKSFSSW